MKIKEEDDKDNNVKVKTASEGYDMINPFVGDNIKVDDSKFKKLVAAEMVDDEDVKPMLTIPLESLTGWSFPLPIKEDGTCDHVTIIKIIDECQKTLANEPDLIKLCIKVNDKEYDELVA